MLLSILIPTITCRKESFQRLYRKLNEQITGQHLEGEVDVLFFLDDRENSIGFKRNQLIERAQGNFVVFVDDDDDVSSDYVWLICQAIRENPGIDCVGIKGQIFFSGKNPRFFVHSLQYRKYFTREEVYYRPPYHLNPIRREIAQRYCFEDISYSEDIDWAMRICWDRALKREVFVDEVISDFSRDMRESECLAILCSHLAVL